MAGVLEQYGTKINKLEDKLRKMEKDMKILLKAINHETGNIRVKKIVKVEKQDEQTREPPINSLDNREQGIEGREPEVN